VDYHTCFGGSLVDYIANLTDYETSLFLRQFWEVQADVYELAAGWIFWSHWNQLGAPWSWSQSAAQNWIPEDPTEKIWPFYANASSYCLDTANPTDGDRNMPSFPGYENNVSNIDITLVKARNITVLSNRTSKNTTSSSNTTTNESVPTISSTSASPTTLLATSAPATLLTSSSVAASAATTSAQSRADRQTLSSMLLGVALVGTLGILHA